MPDLPSSSLEAVQPTLSRIIRDVFHMHPSECPVTEDSQLSDFSMYGLPDHLDNDGATLDELYAAWDDWVLDELKRRYGVDLHSTDVSMVELCRAVEAQSQPALH